MFSVLTDTNSPQYSWDELLVYKWDELVTRESCYSGELTIKCWAGLPHEYSSNQELVSTLFQTYSQITRTRVTHNIHENII